jgi:ferredoxin
VFDLPKVFELENGERVRWRYITDDENIESVKRAAHNCPNRAISFVEGYKD